MFQEDQDPVDPSRKRVRKHQSIVSSPSKLARMDHTAGECISVCCAGCGNSICIAWTLITVIRVPYVPQTATYLSESADCSSPSPDVTRVLASNSSCPYQNFPSAQFLMRHPVIVHTCKQKKSRQSCFSVQLVRTLILVA